MRYYYRDENVKYASYTISINASTLNNINHIPGKYFMFCQLVLNRFINVHGVACPQAMPGEQTNLLLEILTQQIVFRIAIILLPSQRTLTMFLGVYALYYGSAATPTNIGGVLWLNCYHTRKYVVHKCKLVILKQFDKLCLYLELSVDIFLGRQF